MYVDYEYYSEVFLGKLEEDEFNRQLIPACAFVDYATLNRAKKATGDRLTAVKNAVCALIGLLYEAETANQAASSGLSSETVGSWSRSYRAPSSSEEEALQARKLEVIRIYLGPVGLLKAVAKNDVPPYGHGLQHRP